MSICALHLNELHSSDGPILRPGTKHPTTPHQLASQNNNTQVNSRTVVLYSETYEISILS
jgi:hypothetical protein